MLEAGDASGGLHGCPAPGQVPQGLHLRHRDRWAKAAAAFEIAHAGINADLHQQGEGLAVEASGFQDHFHWPVQLADGGEFIQHRCGVAIGEGAEIGHHIEFVGTGLEGGFRFRLFDPLGDRAKGKAHHGDQFWALAFAAAGKGQFLAGQLHPAGGHAHSGKAKVAGLIAAPGDRLVALVGIEQGMVDQGGEVGTVPFQGCFD